MSRTGLMPGKGRDAEYGRDIRRLRNLGRRGDDAHLEVGRLPGYGYRFCLSAAATRKLRMSDLAGGFGARLRACRQSAVLSQQELAERSGLSVRAISDLERGRTRWPYPGSLHRLADALGLCDEARAEFIAAADRRLARAGATGSAWPTGSAGREGEGQGGRAAVLARLPCRASSGGITSWQHCPGSCMSPAGPPWLR